MYTVLRLLLIYVVFGIKNTQTRLSLIRYIKKADGQAVDQWAATWPGLFVPFLNDSAQPNTSVTHRDTPFTIHLKAIFNKLHKWGCIKKTILNKKKKLWQKFTFFQALLWWPKEVKSRLIMWTADKKCSNLKVLMNQLPKWWLFKQWHSAPMYQFMVL